MKRRFFIALLAISSLLTTNVWANPIVTPSELQHNHIHATDASLFSVSPVNSLLINTMIFI